MYTYLDFEKKVEDLVNYVIEERYKKSLERLKIKYDE